MNKYTGFVKCENGYCQMDKNKNRGLQKIKILVKETSECYNK